MRFENLEQGESFVGKVEKAIQEAVTLEEIVNLFKAWAVIMPTIHDPETGNNLSTERIATAIASKNSSVRADECPLFINRALNQRGEGFASD